MKNKKTIEERIERKYKDTKLDWLVFGFAFVLPLIFFTSLIIINKKLISLDEILHYLIVKDSFIHAENLLSPFGKPGYSIFAFIAVMITGDNFGLLPIRIMNGIISSLSCFFVALTIKENNKPKIQAISGALVCMFSQVFYLNSISALTEPLAAFILILGYYLYKKEKFNTHALVLSFGFLVRPEMILIIAVFSIKLLKKKKFVSILLYITFPLFWIGLLLIFRINPIIILLYNSYIDEIELNFKVVPYLGQGFFSFWYYIKEFDNILGWVLIFFFIIGLIQGFKTKKIPFEIWASVLVYYLFEGLILAVPGFGSSGLMRYFVMIIPFMSLITYQGLIWLSSLIIDKIRTISQYNLTKIHQIEKIIILCLFIPIIINSGIILSSNIRIYETDIEKAQINAAKFLSSNYNLKTTTTYCPIFSAPYLLLELYHPILYLDLEYPNRDANEIVTNYTVFYYQGFFINYTFYENLLETPKSGSIIIWVNYMYEDSIFNPNNINSSRFTQIYDELESDMHITIYYVD